MTGIVAIPKPLEMVGVRRSAAEAATRENGTHNIGTDS
jgi:hypothetical protein